MSEESRRRWRPAWTEARFSWEGIAAAAAAVLVALLLPGWLEILSWIALAIALLIAFGTRTADRVRPEGERIVAPCDGVVQSVEAVVPPEELRLEGEGGWQRVRIASSPVSVATVFAPVSGVVASRVDVEGVASSVLATDPEAAGLNEIFATFKHDDGMAGVRLAAAGLGPRLDADVDPGAPLALGEPWAQRRMGGWCDIYLKERETLSVRPGQIVVGGQTGLVAAQDRRVPVTARTEAEAPVLADSPPTEDDAAKAFDRLRRAAAEAGRGTADATPYEAATPLAEARAAAREKARAEAGESGSLPEMKVAPVAADGRDARSGVREADRGREDGTDPSSST